MTTVNEKLLDRAIRHALYFQRFKSTEANDVLRFLDRKVFPDVTRTVNERLAAAAIAGIDRGPWTTAYVRDIRAAVGSVVTAGVKTAAGGFQSTMQDFVVSEAAFQTSLLKENVPLDVDFRTPSPELLRSIVTTKPIEGIPFGGWWKKLGEDTRANITEAVRVGVAQGEKPERIIRRLTGTAKNGFKDGVYQTARYRAEAMVRTIAAKMQNEASYQALLANADTVKGYQFVATLDTRTTVICMGHDGKVFDLKDRRGLPPLHWNCRSTIVAVTKSWEEIGLGGLGLKEPPSAGTRASMGGEVAEKLTYPEWLGKQSQAIQNDALGFGRAEIFRRGKLPIERFYDQHNRPLTLDELYAAEARANAAATKKAAAAKAAAEAAAAAEKRAAAKALAARQKSLDEKYEAEKAAALRAQYAAQDAAAAEQAAFEAAQEKAAAEAAAIAQAQAEAEAAKAAADAAAAQAEIEAAAVAAEQSEHDAAVAAVVKASEEAKAVAAQAQAVAAQAAVDVVEEAQSAAKNVGKAAADAVVLPAPGANPIAYGTAAKDAVASALKALEDELAAADVALPGFADAKKKALKKAYDSAWKKASDLAKKGKQAELAAITKDAAEKATAEIKAAAAAVLKDSVAAAEKAAKEAVANAIAKAKAVEGAKAAGQAAKAEVDAAYAKLLAKKAGKISAAEAHALAEEGKKAAKTAYDKAWQVAKAAEKKAAKLAAKTGGVVPPPAPVPPAAAQTAQAAKAVEAAAAKAETPASMKKWALEKPPRSDEIADSSGWTRYAEQKGSNPGGFYRDQDGVEWYVKTPQTEEHAYNEVLAGRLYSLTGTKAAQTKLVRHNGKLSVASRIEKLHDAKNKKGIVSFAQAWKDAGEPSKAAHGFATDAWLANWDCVGLSGDNLLFDQAGNLVRIDSGGALRFRAKGGPKGAAFGDLVNEIDTLRGAGAGSGTKASEVFKHLTDTEIVESIDRVLAVSVKDIAQVVENYGPRDLSERNELRKRLLARREDLQKRRDYFMQRALGIKPARPQGKLAEKWGLRVELKRQQLSVKEIETMPESGPSFFGPTTPGDVRKSSSAARAWEDWRKKLTPEQVRAIREWSGSGYGAMRRAQETAAQLGRTLGTGGDADIAVLRVESALHHAPRHRGRIQRGIRWDAAKHGEPNFEKGDVFELEAISSFSRDLSTAESFAGADGNYGSMTHTNRVPVILHVEDSYSTVDIRSLSGIPDEEELLALRRSKFRVLRVDRVEDKVDPVTNKVVRRGRIDVHLEEISGKE